MLIHCTVSIMCSYYPVCCQAAGRRFQFVFNVRVNIMDVNTRVFFFFFNSAATELRPGLWVFRT